MTLKLLSWNVRGLNNPRKREVCKNLLKEWRCDIVYLQETKFSSVNSAVLRSLSSSPFSDWAVLDAVQSFRGVLLLWDKQVVEKIDVSVGRFSVSVLLRGVLDGFEWVCTGIYGPNADNRAALWEELPRVRTRWNKAWLLFGDFNVVRYPCERLGCDSFSPAMFAFSDFINRNCLVDLPLQGASFTWFQDSISSSMSRIDKTLSLQIGRTILVMCLRGCFLVLFLIIVCFWWKLGMWVGGVVPLSLRICG